MQSVAVAGLLGVDGWRMATATDPAEVLLLAAVTDAAAEVRESWAQDLANRIANATWNDGK